MCKIRGQGAVPPTSPPTSSPKSPKFIQLQCTIVAVKFSILLQPISHKNEVNVRKFLPLIQTQLGYIITTSIYCFCTTFSGGHYLSSLRPDMCLKCIIKINMLQAP